MQNGQFPGFPDGSANKLEGPKAMRHSMVYQSEQRLSMMWDYSAACLRPDPANSEQPTMLPFRVLEHTADIGFEAFGATRQDVFRNAARALTHLMVDLEAIAPCEGKLLRVEASDKPSLLVNWLSEILYLFDAEGWLFRDFEFDALTERSLSAMARGEKFDRRKHQVKLLVKAVTYHQLDLMETAEGWRAQVYVDI
jgi:SHS2 domain-containing protein